MAKAKDAINDLRNKLFDRQKQDIIETAEVVLEKNADMDNVTYDVIQDPSTKSRSFVIVKLKYDLKTLKAEVIDVRPFQDKAAGLTMIMDKENRKYLFEKNRSKK